MKPKEVKWKPVQIPRELADDLETFAKSGLTRSLGFTNKSQIAAFAIRAFLERHADYLAVYQLVDATEDKVMVLDHELNQTIELKINEEEFLHCDIDDDDYCEHVKFALACPSVLHYLKKYRYPDEHGNISK